MNWALTLGIVLTIAGLVSAAGLSGFIPFPSFRISEASGFLLLAGSVVVALTGIGLVVVGVTIA